MEAVLNVKNITKRINGNIILDNISFSINSGEIMGIKGRNGSGKSMLFKALTGLIVLDSGEIELYGQSIFHKNALSQVGALIEYPGFLPNLNGYMNLSLLASIKRKATENEIKKAMRELNLEPDNKIAFKKYSIGMRQKLGIAAAIMENPKLLILDEPCNNLDVESVELVRKLLTKLNREMGTTILIASHNVSDFETLCTRLCEIKLGQLEVIQ